MDNIVNNGGFDFGAVIIFGVAVTIGLLSIIILCYRERNRISTVIQVEESSRSENTQFIVYINNTNDECPICLEKINNGCITECCHKFCLTCLNDWLKIRQTCPICNLILSVV